MISPTETAPTAAGWYPDPDGLNQSRFWAGDHWTKHITIGPAHPGQVASRPLKPSLFYRIFEPKTTD